MTGSGAKWLIGCGGFILLLIAITVGGGIWMTRPMRHAVNAQKELQEKYGSRDSYVPPAEALSADRLEVFLGVRQALVPSCEGFASLGASFERMNKIDEGGEEVSRSEVLKAVGGVMGSVMGLVGQLGELIRIRNEALLAAGMSHGEYIWIYVLTYHSWLGHPAGTSFDGEGGQLSTGERKTMWRLMRNHARVLRDAGDENGSRAWEEEIRRLERTEAGVPFLDLEMPSDLVAVLAPFEQRLEEVYCPQTAAFELNTIRKKGLSFHSN